MKISQREPPSEYLLWSVGPLDTEYGRIDLTAELLASAHANYAKRQREICFDYEHLSADDEANPSHRISPASCKLELRANGQELWLSQIQWSPLAGEQVGRREWLYTSPDFTLTSDANGPVSIDLHKIALTNDPATWGARPLVDTRVKLSRQLEKKPLTITTTHGNRYSMPDSKLDAMGGDASAAPAESAESARIAALRKMIQSVMTSDMVPSDVATVIQSMAGIVAEMESSQKAEVEAPAELSAPVSTGETGAVLSTSVDEPKTETEPKLSEAAGPPAEDEKKLALLSRRFKGLSAAQIEGELMALELSSKEAQVQLSTAQTKAVQTEAQAKEDLVQLCIKEGKVSPKNAQHLADLRAASIETVRHFHSRAPSLFARVATPDSPTTATELGLGSFGDARVALGKTKNGRTVLAHKKL